MLTPASQWLRLTGTSELYKKRKEGKKHYFTAFKVITLYTIPGVREILTIGFCISKVLMFPNFFFFFLFFPLSGMEFTVWIHKHYFLRKTFFSSFFKTWEWKVSPLNVLNGDSFMELFYTLTTFKKAFLKVIEIQGEFSFLTV